MTKVFSALKKDNLLEVSLCSIGFCLFALFIHRPFPWNLISFFALIYCAYLISKSYTSIPKLKALFNISLSRKLLLYTVLAIVLGLVYSYLFRSLSYMNILPARITYFGIIAALIGSAEEIIFRGYIQDRAGSKSIVFGVFYASLSHSVYKSCLFIFPSSHYDYNLLYLFLLTFGGGILFGILKEASKSIIPPIVAHALFDIMVYGELAQAPWWVW